MGMLHERLAIRLKFDAFFFLHFFLGGDSTPSLISSSASLSSFSLHETCYFESSSIQLIMLSNE